MNPLQALWLIGLSLVPSLSPATPTATSRPQLAVSVAAAPTKSEAAVAPVVNAKGAMLVDLPSQTVLYSRNPDEARPIASLTKLMTVLLAVEQLPADKVVTVPKLTTTTDESRIDLHEGQQLRVEDLLAATLIASANDAAGTLAVAAGQSEESFVKQMNARAQEMGLTKTHFANSTGYDTGQSYSSPRDLVLLSRAVLAEPRLRAVTGLKELTIKAADGTEYQLKNTDDLIGGYLPIAGLKTGTTDAAGPCLISVLGGDHQLLAVALNSPDRFQENKSMLDWGLRAYQY